MERETSTSPYFFAQADARTYDATIELVVPHYRLLHESLVETVRYHAAAVGHEPYFVLDLGSGTGTATLGVLNGVKAARAIAVDAAVQIQEFHRRRTPPEVDNRTTFVVADVMGAMEHPLGFRQWLHEVTPGGFSLITSVFLLHHFSHEQKERFYSTCYDALRPGGRLVIGDLFSYADETLARGALQHDLAWIRTHFGEASKRGCLAAADAVRLDNLWTAHYLHDNRCEPVEDSEEIGQARMMADSGFESISVPYRFSLSGILTGVRL